MSHASNSGRSDRDVLNSRILIVDDEESNVRLLEYLLHREGYRSVGSTTHPREVVQIYEEFFLACPPPETGPDVVLGFGPKKPGYLGRGYGQEAISTGRDYL